ncbi:MAG: zinc ribbon domain-containing protein [Candidatus Marinimicrobia bacterium]|nr:zinc ribbon domain-containing protein [Candidatus Neomarinimicrobiota bacterium]MCF7827970.1 zinc ribbon domain-containing protein [Candidatus Neomarinimicrobiota bacterium]MCF7879275.1 zinc ribbon domain-containing protein [Candidatus Neomarinimicrobiota bacterium]
MYCTQCGTELPDQAQFCAKCGAEKVNRWQTKSQHSENSGNNPQDSTEGEFVTEEKDRYNRKAPPKISPLYLFLALVGIGLILVLLNPWHAEQERPEDFEGTRNSSQQITPIKQNIPSEVLFHINENLIANFE